MHTVSTKISNAHWSQLYSLRYTEMKRWLRESYDEYPVRGMYTDCVSLYTLCGGYEANDLHNHRANWSSISIRVVGR